MRQDHLGIFGAAGLLAVTALDVAVMAPGPKPKRRAKPSGQPIPEGTMTRQQRRANERENAKPIMRLHNPLDKKGRR